MKSFIIGTVVGLTLCVSTPVFAQGPQRPHYAVKHQRGGLPVSINQATQKQLRGLPGIGKKTAQRIVDYRQQHGAFKSVNDLAKVRGVSTHRVQSWGKQVQL